MLSSPSEVLVKRLPRRLVVAADLAAVEVPRAPLANNDNDNKSNNRNSNSSLVVVMIVIAVLIHILNLVNKNKHHGLNCY